MVNYTGLGGYLEEQDLRRISIMLFIHIHIYDEY